MRPPPRPPAADAEQVAAELHRWPDVQWSALLAGVGGAGRAVAAGIVELEYVVSAADGHSPANARRTGVDAVAERVVGHPLPSNRYRTGGMSRPVPRPVASG